MNSIPTDIHTYVKKDADTIIRVCSYHRRDFDLVVVRFAPTQYAVGPDIYLFRPPSRHCPLLNLGSLITSLWNLCFWCSIISTFVLSSTSVRSTGELASYQPDSTNINWSPSMAWRACEVCCAPGLLIALPLSTKVSDT